MKFIAKYIMGMGCVLVVVAMIAITCLCLWAFNSCEREKTYDATSPATLAEPEYEWEQVGDTVTVHPDTMGPWAIFVKYSDAEKIEYAKNSYNWKGTLLAYYDDTIYDKITVEHEFTNVKEDTNTVVVKNEHPEKHPSPREKMKLDETAGKYKITFYMTDGTTAIVIVQHG
ncbi:MAG: hypothetical protein LBN08_00370 [Lactobacillales bacterium]|jgi:hypothetical protein|nr:hypothetical protein [Lactobacillales bacterium]